MRTYTIYRFGISAFIFFLALVLTARSAFALDKSQVIGFWAHTTQEGAASIKTEAWFAADGTFELRAQAEILGEQSGMTGRGHWRISGEKVITDGDGPCMEDFGNGKAPCVSDDGDTLDTLTIEGTGTARRLMGMDDGEVINYGDYQGAQKKFTLPDLLATTALAGGAPKASLEMRGTVRNSPAARTGIDIFDLFGRHLPGPGAAAPTVSLPARNK